MDNSEGNVKRYHFIRSLKLLSAIHVAKQLWNQKSMGDEIYNLQTSTHAIGRITGWQRIEGMVLSIATALALPDSLYSSLEFIVREMGEEIVSWLEHVDQFVFKDMPGAPLGDMAVNYIGALKWTSRGTIDYKETAKTLLLNNELRNDYKYVLSCINCLEEDIPIIAQRLVIAQTRLDYSNYFTIYWSSCVTGGNDFSRLVNTYNQLLGHNKSSYEFLFFDAIQTSNEAGLRYVWHKLSDEEKAMNIIGGVEAAWSSAVGGIMSFLLSQIVELWQSSPFYLKQYFFEKRNYEWSEMFVQFLKVKDFETINMLLLGTNDEQGVDVFYNRIFLEVCLQDCDFLQILINQIFPEKVNSFKRYLVESYEESNACFDLMIWGNDLDKVGQFLSWFFETEDKVRNFKRQLAYNEDKSGTVPKMLKPILFGTETSFAKLDKFLAWCFLSEEEINKCKAIFPYTSAVREMIHNCTKYGQDFEEILKWCLYEKT